jgi:hypothetical protein
MFRARVGQGHGSGCVFVCHLIRFRDLSQYNETAPVRGSYIMVLMCKEETGRRRIPTKRGTVRRAPYSPPIDP